MEESKKIIYPQKDFTPTWVKYGLDYNDVNEIEIKDSDSQDIKSEEGNDTSPSDK